MNSNNFEIINQFENNFYGNGYTLYLKHDNFDNLIVSDAGNHCLKFFDENNKFISSFGSYGSQKSQFSCPMGST